MKYKNIPSMLHNFGHSFMSVMNYVDDVVISDVLIDVLKQLPVYRLEIHFPSQAILPEGTYPATLIKAIQNYAEWLPEHAAHHGLDPSVVHEVSLVVWGDQRGMHCLVKAKDDRGKEYEVDVRQAA